MILLRQEIENTSALQMNFYSQFLQLLCIYINFYNFVYSSNSAGEMELLIVNFPLLYAKLYTLLWAGICQLESYCNVCAYYLCILPCNVYCSDPLELSFHCSSCISNNRVHCLESGYRKCGWFRSLKSVPRYLYCMFGWK